MKNTKNYGLIKPDSSEYYDVEQFNSNMDVIDEKMKEIENSTSEVENVSTNNQTPTYTVKSTLVNLVSGEKLSDAMGKIARVVKEVISHVANQSNPHKVTVLQLGALTSGDVVDNLESTSTTLPLSANQGNKIKSTLSEKAPTNHASNLTTYGLGDASNYGHVKLSDNLHDLLSSANGVAATPLALRRAYYRCQRRAYVTARGSVSELSLSAGELTQIVLDIDHSTDYYGENGGITQFATSEDGGLICPVDGIVLVSGSVYIKSTSDARKKGCYIKHKQTNETQEQATEICSQYIYEGEGAEGCVSAGSRMLYVYGEDELYLYARSSKDSTCAPNNECTYLNVVYLSYD